VRPLNFGNADLGPERTSEVEVGFDASMLSDRLSIDFTAFHDRTTDALLPVALIPSMGFFGRLDALESQATQLRNVGKLKKQGLEVGVNGTPLRGELVTWDLGFTVSTNRSEVLDLGAVNGIPVPAFSLGNFGWVIKGQPVPVLRGRRIRNANDIAAPVIDTNYTFGPTQPTRIIGVNTMLTFPHGVRLSARGEYQGGHYINEDASYQALTRSVRWPTCTRAYTYLDRHTAADSAQLTAWERSTCIPTNVRDDMFIFPADFFKLRDVTLSVPVSGRLLRGINSATLSLSAGNWYRWQRKEFRVFDPEMSGNGGFNEAVRYISEQIPAPATFTARLRVSF
jgi:hypothetical protein